MYKIIGSHNVRRIKGSVQVSVKNVRKFITKCKKNMRKYHYKRFILCVKYRGWRNRAIKKLHDLR